MFFFMLRARRSAYYHAVSQSVFRPPGRSYVSSLLFYQDTLGWVLFSLKKQTRAKHIQLDAILKKSPLLLFVFSLLMILPLYSQEATPDNDDSMEQEYILYNGDEPASNIPPPHPIDGEISDNDRLYVIAAFEFDIRGRTRPNALMHNAELRIGEELHGRARLEEYIRDRTQVLTNMRVLRDTVEISYSVGERREDGAYPVTFTIRVEDTWNVIALPVPYYDTNDGLDLTVRARDYNFMGTMSPLRIDLGYQRDMDGRNSFELLIDSNIPFTMLGRRWNFKVENILQYRPEAAETFFFQNITGLSVELPFRRTTFTVGFEESFILNQENPRRHRLTDEYGQEMQPWHTFPENFQRGLYMSSRMFASWRIPTGLTTSRFGELTYTMRPSMTFNHELPDWPLQDFRRGPFANFSHSLGFGRINWHGNYRSGLSVSLSNSFSYDFFRYDRIRDPFNANLSFTATNHLIVSRFFGISTRLQSRQWFFFDGRGYHDNAGDVLRGIADRSMQADYMLSLNMDFPLRVLVFAPSQWLDNRRLRLFDFEFHLSPVLDLAFFNDLEMGRDIAAAGGLEFIVFPAFMRALYLRLSVGVNVLEALNTRSIPGGENREISFGLGHFF